MNKNRQRSGNNEPRIRIDLNWCSAVSGHADSLVSPAVAAHATSHIGGVGAVLAVVSEGSCQGGLQLLGPFLVGLGEPTHLIRSQAKVAEDRPERLARVDGVEELLPHVGW
jgi:hypothetical protein